MTATHAKAQEPHHGRDAEQQEPDPDRRRSRDLPDGLRANASHAGAMPDLVHAMFQGQLSSGRQGHRGQDQGNQHRSSPLGPLRADLQDETWLRRDTHISLPCARPPGRLAASSDDFGCLGSALKRVPRSSALCRKPFAGSGKPRSRSPGLGRGVCLPPARPGRQAGDPCGYPRGIPINRLLVEAQERERVGREGSDVACVERHHGPDVIGAR